MEMDILEMCEDNQMACLRDTLLRTGKGRRPTLPDFAVNNKLFIQLYQLRFEGERRLTEVEKWWTRLFPQSSYPVNRVWKLCQRIAKGAKGKQQDDLAAYLSTPVNLNFISEALQSVGVDRSLDRSCMHKCTVTNAIVMDLGSFLLGERHSYVSFLDILSRLSHINIPTMSVEKFRQQYLAADKKRAKLVKNAKANPVPLRTWLNEPFFQPSATPEQPQSAPSQSVNVKSSPPREFSTSESDWPSLPNTTQTPCSSPSCWPPVKLELKQSPLPVKPVSFSSSSPPANITPAASSSTLPAASSSSLPAASPSSLPAASSSSLPAASSSSLPAASSSSLPAASSSTLPAASSSSLPAASSSALPAASSSSLPAASSSTLPAASSPSLPAASSSTLPAASSPSLPAASSSTLPAASSSSLPEASSSTLPTNTTLNSPLPSLLPDNSTLHSTITSLKKEVKDIKRKLKGEIMSHKDTEKELKDIKKSKLYRKNCDLKKEVDKMKTIIFDLSEELRNLKKSFEQEKVKHKEETEVFKKKIKSEKTVKARHVKITSRIKSDIKSLQNETTSDTDITSNLKVTGNSCNQYSDNVRLTYMALMGEANVSAENCAKVVEIVSKNLFGKKINTVDLPSTSTALNFVNEAYHIAGQHVAEKIREKDHFTFATDATSRQKKHYLERHIVLNNNLTLSLGFCEIAADDSDTLLEKSIEIFDDISEMYCTNVNDCSKDDVLKDIIKKLKSLMSDRAAVMKCFDKKMDQFKKELLGDQEPSIHFLFCNAHFLLGLAHATEESLSLLEKDFGKLGRDLDGAFVRFFEANECSALRLIRTVAEVLGPRGDEKNGCRQEWLAFCELKGKSSKFTSYRSNRFNCLFENASAIVDHHSNVLEFLNDYVSHSNLKLKSICADLSDKTILAFVASVALFHSLFTGPYWKLVNSNKTYGDFPSYVSKMSEALNQWESTELVLNSLSTVFTDDDFVMENRNLQSFLSSPECDIETVKLCFRSITTKSLVVLQRQLADFLEGGIFGGVIDESVQKILDTCPLTNLTGERMFGDFDFDMQKRRRASLHLRTTLHMLKRNKTMTWIRKQKKEKTAQLLQNARKHSLKWKKKSKDREANVRIKIKERIRENNRTKKEKEVKTMEEKNKVLNCVLDYGGVCSTKEDIDNLMSKPNALQNIKAQIRYRKVFLGEHILLSGNLKTLYKRLCDHLNIALSMSDDNSDEGPLRKKARR